MTDDYIMHRPEFPSEHWIVEEQRMCGTYSETTFVRWSKIHPIRDREKVYLILTEANPKARKNELRKELFTVRGGRNARPDEKVRKFVTYESAAKHLSSMINETERFYSQIETEEAKAKYLAWVENLEQKLNKDEG
jgi:hypothetical protein